jgi:tetratricopeptide (TPR) repeat protein
VLPHTRFGTPTEDEDEHSQDSRQLAQQLAEQLKIALKEKDTEASRAAATLRKLEYEREQAQAEKAALREQAEQSLAALHQQKDDEVKAVKAELAARKTELSAKTADLSARTKELSSRTAELATAQRQLKDTQAALRFYQASDAADKELALSYYASGAGQLRRGLLAEAIKSFTSAIETYPKDARFFYMRAIARQQTTEGNDDAIADAKRGATLEDIDAENTPRTDRALEHFQGKTRLWLEKHRVVKEGKGPQSRVGVLRASAAR